MGRLTKRSNKTSHENGVCCTHFMSKECVQFGGECAWGCKWEEAAWGKLADYEEAEEQGLLLRLPCKVGDTVYHIEDGCIYEFEAKSIDIRKEDDEYIYCIDSMDYRKNDFGKIAFLTVEEAEQALAKMKEV